MPKNKVTISIPKELYEQIEKEIDGTGFSSPSEWIRYILRQAVAATKSSDRKIISIPYLGND